MYKNMCALNVDEIDPRKREREKERKCVIERMFVFVYKICFKF